MKPAETSVYEFLSEKAINNAVFATAEVFPNPDVDLPRMVTEGVWIYPATGDFIETPVDIDISDAVLTLSIRAFVHDRDTTARTAELQKATDISAEIFKWIAADETLEGRSCNAAILGFDNGVDQIDSSDYVGINLYVVFNDRGRYSREALLAKARRSF